MCGTLHPVYVSAGSLSPYCGKFEKASNNANSLIDLTHGVLRDGVIIISCATAMDLKSTPWISDSTTMLSLLPKVTFQDSSCGYWVQPAKLVLRKL